MDLEGSLTVLVSLFLLSSLGSSHPQYDMAAEVEGYVDVAKRIIDLAVLGAAQNRSYRRLSDFTDTVGNRVSGSKNLDMAIKYMAKAMEQDGLHVHLEPAKIPHWVRGKENAEMIEPRAKRLPILGLGGSVATPPQDKVKQQSAGRGEKEMENNEQERRPSGVECRGREVDVPQREMTQRLDTDRQEKQSVGEIELAESGEKEREEEEQQETVSQETPHPRDETGKAVATVAENIRLGETPKSSVHNVEGHISIQAEVLVVQSFEELKRRRSEATGKIVAFNQPFVTYGETVAYRENGASEAAKVGALATLIRSITPFSINSPHTGWQDYQDGVKRIPTACITVEDAELMARITQRGERIVVKLMMEAKTLPDVDSFNTVAEIEGWQYPEQVVLLSGHLDSWDVGQGAMDDGGGAIISWEALSLIKDLGLRPRRTLRAVLWTAEEQGGVGAQQYFDQHKGNLSNFDLVMESDLGTFTPVALQFTGNDAARTVMEQVVKLLAPINTTRLEMGGEGTDISPWLQAGVPGASLHVADSQYFWFHHTEADTMTVQNSKDMDLCSALWAVVAYVVADLKEMLPR